MTHILARPIGPMLRSPNKNFSRKFLRYLKHNYFTSPGGKEYCEAEVLEMLDEKESRLSVRDELHRQKKDAPSPDPIKWATEHQEAILSLVKTWET